MTGDAPQPGETPRNDSNLWSYREPDAAWWRPENERSAAGELTGAGAGTSRPRRRRVPVPVEKPQPGGPIESGPGDDRPAGSGPAGAEPPFAVEALDAHAAGVQDAAEALVPPAEAQATAVVSASAGPEPQTQAGRDQETEAGRKQTAEAGRKQKNETGREQNTEARRELKTEARRELKTEARREQTTETGREQNTEAVGTTAEPVERDHDAPTEERFLPTAARGRAGRRSARKAPPATEAGDAEPKTEPEAEPRTKGKAEARSGYATEAETETAPKTASEAEADPAASAASVPEDVMVLPEPGRNRPTVALDRSAVPGQSRTKLSPAAERARERMENSPFWMSDEERAAASETRARVAAPGEELRGKPPRTKPRTPRRPAPGLIGLVALGLIAAFFSWVSAEPFWLAVGHGDEGLATVTRCEGSGVTQRCSGSFAADGGEYTVRNVALLGVEASQSNPGAVAPARMVSADSRQVYLGETGLLINLRWVLGFVLVLLCGYGVAGLTGARLLETARARRGAVLISLAGPLLMLTGFLVAAY